MVERQRKDRPWSPAAGKGEGAVQNVHLTKKPKASGKGPLKQKERGQSRTTS